jgi:hypothetical protein
VFFAVAIPFFVFGYTRSGALKTILIVAGILLGLFLGVIAGLWVAGRSGEVWKGPRV